MLCRYCEKEIPTGEEVSTHSYWKPFKYWSHNDCKKKGEASEAYECQKLDSDCNDCKFFERGKLLRKGVYTGHCKKFDKEVKAFPNFCSGRECFKHRKD